MSYIVTGGAGFVGSNMVRTLNKNGIKDAVIVDNYDESKMPNLLDLHFTDYIDYSDGLEAVDKKLRSIPIEGIFHIGADADVLDYNPKQMMMLNYEFSKMYCKVRHRMRHLKMCCLIIFMLGQSGSLTNILLQI